MRNARGRAPRVMPVAAFLIGDALFLALALAAIWAVRFRGASSFVYAVSLAVSLLLLVAAATRLISADTPSVLILPLGLPRIGAHFRIDALSAFFLAVVNFGAAAASLYALGYGRHEHEPGRMLPFFPAFLAAMNFVLVADDALHFPAVLGGDVAGVLGAGDGASRRAGKRSRGLRLYPHGQHRRLRLAAGLRRAGRRRRHYAFAAMRAHPPTPIVAGIVLALALTGAGSKAGLAPFHVWLPLAHPAAPSHVSALMSGVMTKVAVYGFIRIVFDLVGSVDWWWGIPVMSLGATSAVLGVLFAQMQSDMKRVLAYSTIENIGVIFIALGLSLAFEAGGYGPAAALAMTAALFHVLNHSLFKTLLFFGAGAVLTATGARDLGRLGGLLNRMPATGLFVLIGCAAISALPPLNGFVSEWLVFQAILLSPSLPVWTLKLMIPAVGAMLALAAALAGACFVRLFGIAFLGRPRSAEAVGAVDVDRFSLTSMGVLSGLCLLTGMFPGVVIDALAPIVRADGRRQHDRAKGEPGWLSIVPIAESRSSYNGLLVFFFIAFSALLAAFVIHRLASSRSAARRPGIAAFPSPIPSPNIRRKVLRPADPPGLRGLRLSLRGKDRHAAARRSSSRPLRCAPARPRVGAFLRAGDRRRAGCGQSAERAAIPHHPPISQPGLRRPGVSSAGSRRSGPDWQASPSRLSQMLVVLLLAPLLTGFVRKVKARLLLRRGPPLLQPYHDLIKLTQKEVIVAESASWLFRAAPYLIFSATWVAAALAPTFAIGLLFSWSADLIAIIALLGSARFFLALAGMDVGTSFGGLGSSREMMFATLAEPALIMIVFTLALIAGSTATFLCRRLHDVARRGPARFARHGAGRAGHRGHRRERPHPGRQSLNPSGAHHGPRGDGARIFGPASGDDRTVVAAQAAALCYADRLRLRSLGSRACRGAFAAPMRWGWPPMLGKLAAAGLLLALFEVTVAKMRVFRVPDFIGVALMLGLLATLLRFMSRGL